MPLRRLNASWMRFWKSATRSRTWAGRPAKFKLTHYRRLATCVEVTSPVSSDVYSELTLHSGEFHFLDFEGVEPGQLLAKVFKFIAVQFRLVAPFEGADADFDCYADPGVVPIIERVALQIGGQLRWSTLSFKYSSSACPIRSEIIEPSALARIDSAYYSLSCERAGAFSPLIESIERVHSHPRESKPEEQER